MSLTSSYVLTPAQVPALFQAIARGQAPPQFTVQYLRDLGFTATNHRAFIRLLKALGFLSGDGTPTARYHQYRDPSSSRRVMGEALREAYGDLFLIKAQPTKADRALIEGKFKSAHNVSDNVAANMASSFFALLALADTASQTHPAVPETRPASPTPPLETPAGPELHAPLAPTPHHARSTSLHYNIQIHLPATKDVEVYNAIFKSLREHLVD